MRVCATLWFAAFVLSVALLPAAAVSKTTSDADRLARLEKIIHAQQKLIQAQEKRLKQLERARAVQRSRKRKQQGQRYVRRGDTVIRRRIIKSGADDSFTSMDDQNKLSIMRGGIMVPAVRVVLPDGRTMLAPADRFKPLLVQQVKPKDPSFETAPETDKKKAAPKKRTVRRRTTVRRSGQRPQRRVVRRTQQRQQDDSVRANSQKQTDQLLVNTGAILLRPGTLQIEPTFEYTRASASNVAINGLSLFNAIVIGTIRVDALNRDILTGSLKVRYGILSRLQFDATIPFVYRHEVEVLGVGTADINERHTNGYGIGDIELGLTGQPIIGSGWVPNVLVRVGFKIPTGEHVFEIPTVTVGAGGETRLVRSPTGSGFYAVAASATAVWAIDPVSLFVGTGYTYNIPRTFRGGFGRINPGNTISFFSGINVALNEKVSLNLSFISQRTGSTKQGSAPVPNTAFTDARVTLGASVALWSNVSLITNASIGLTRQSPDFTFTVSLPISFNTR